MRGHNFTQCRHCGREYICGDCITSDCELGHDRRKCEHYQAAIAQRRASAIQMMQLVETGTDKQRGCARLLAGLAWDDVCKSLTNSELTEALKEKVWANMALGTEEIALMEQAIDRLEGKKA